MQAEQQDGTRVADSPLSLPSASPSPLSLDSLRGLRQAPVLDPDQRGSLRAELAQRLAGCAWFTVGVMAADRETAVSCLRQLEQSQGWPALEEDSSQELDPEGGPVFLKGNQRNGLFRVRVESGVAEGLLITGHNPDNPAAEDTWGPLPLDLFR
jgi:hypothetical protein